MTENLELSGAAAADEDGAVVLSIPVPVLTKTVSAPELCSMRNGSASGSNNSRNNTADSENGKQNNKEVNPKVQLLKNYRLHIFVFAIFFITVLSVSLSWHFRNMAQEQLYASQTIFFNPRTRELTLADPTSTASVRGHLGIDIPLWMLPLHCPIVSNGDPHYKECLWKNNALLKIVHFEGENVQCYNISWKSLDPTYAPHDCFYINSDKWYGPSNQSAKSFPISGEFNFQPKKNYTIINNGIFNSVVDFYWLSSNGAAIYVNANNPIQLTWNITGDNLFCITSNTSGPLYHKTNAYDYPDMNYTLCNGMDSMTTHTFMQKLLAPNNSLGYPPTHILQGTHWSMKSSAKTENITQSHVIDLLANITEHGFLDNHITLDGKWQEAHGDLLFDVQRFPNVTEMLELLHSNNSHMTICVSPYFQYSSRNFHEGIITSVFVKDAGGEVTGLTNFTGVLTAILDVFAEGAVQWYREKLEHIVSRFGIKSYRLTYGDQSWLPYKPHFSDVDATPNSYRKMVTESFAKLPGSSFIVEHTSDSRHVPTLIPVVSEIRLVQGKMCITEAIETALTLGLMGYPFVMADGVRIETDQNTQLSGEGLNMTLRDAYIRWMQLANFFPAYQFSIAPWEFDAEVVGIAKNLSVQLRPTILLDITDNSLREEVAKGAPILRPVWWLDSDNRTVHDMEIADEFLIGNNLLVAPILCADTKDRDIYVPSGVWEDVDLGTFVLGPTILRDYKVSITSIPMFRKRIVINEQTNSEL